MKVYYSLSNSPNSSNLLSPFNPNDHSVIVPSPFHLDNNSRISLLNYSSVPKSFDPDNSSRYRYCQSQVGSSDCGLFALTFASVIAMGNDPGRFEHERHLHSCLNKGTFSTFPTRHVGRKVHKITNIVKIPVYCKYQTPEIKDLMIQCSTCSEWYHIDAVCKSQKRSLKKDLPFGWLCDNCDKISYNVVYNQFKSLLQ